MDIVNRQPASSVAMFRLVPKEKLHRSKKLKRFTFSLLNHIIKAYKQSAEVNRMTKKEKIENFIEEYNGYLITSLVCSEDISKTYIAKYIK